MNILIKSIAYISSTLILSNAGFCAPSMTAQPISSWHYSIAPYLWASSLKGDVEVKGRKAQINVPFSQIIKNLNFAAQGHMEAGYGPWSLMLDPTYLKVTDKGQFHSIGLKVTTKTVLVDAGIFYRLFSKPIKENRYVSLEVLGGARHLGIGNTIDVEGLTFAETVKMNSPIVGARLRADLSSKTSFWLRGDIGGFHVDHVNQTWSATAGLAYAFREHIDFGIAYRALKMDYAKNKSIMNLLMQGPEIGVSFHG